jgi:hypothetical protein
MCMILTKPIGPYKMNSIRQFFNSILEAIVEARKARSSQLANSLTNRV